MVKTNMSSNGPSLGPDPNSDSRKLSCRSKTAVLALLSKWRLRALTFNWADVEISGALLDI